MLEHLGEINSIYYASNQLTPKSFLLGGGLSYLSPAHGFGCDNYVSLDVVLTSGKLVTATESNDHADLFRALKGGGSRFGIITRYEVNAFYTGTSLDKTWYGGTVVVSK